MMRHFYRTVLVSVGVAILILAFSGSQEPVETFPLLSSPLLMERDAKEWPKELKGLEANTLLIGAGLRLFALAEGRWPRDLEELLRSPYVALVDGPINPYTGKPLREVKGASRVLVQFGEYPVEVYRRESIEPGDVVYWIETDGIPRVEFPFVEPQVTPRYLLAVNYAPGHIPTAGELVNPKPGSYEYWWKWEAEKISLIQDPLEKRALANCSYLNLAIASVHNYGVEAPLTAEELFSSGLIYRIKNPYTGAPARSVPLNAPSPGDFTYAGVLDTRNRPPRSLKSGLSLCYGSGGRIVNQAQRETMAKYQEMEAAWKTAVELGMTPTNPLPPEKLVELRYLPIYYPDGTPILKVLHIAE